MRDELEELNTPTPPSVLLELDPSPPPVQGLTPPPFIMILHDAENCTVGRDVAFSVYTLKQLVLERVKHLSAVHKFKGGSKWEVRAVKPQWNFILEHDAKNKYHPTHKIRNDLIDNGFTPISPGIKKDAVDTKLKELVTTFVEREHGREERWVVVLITGDRDFGAEVRNLTQHGFFCVVMHTGNARSEFLAQADASCGDWDELVREASIPMSPARLIPPLNRTVTLNTRNSVFSCVLTCTCVLVF